jgi:hypothetical protein
MSNNTAGRKTQKADGQAATSEIAQFYSYISAIGFQPRLRFVSGICEFNIVGAGIWRVIIKDGVPTITQDTASTAKPDCVVTCAAEDFLRVVHRENHINVMSALLQGLIGVTGDLGFASMVLGSAILEPTGSASVELHP